MPRKSKTLYMKYCKEQLHDAVKSVKEGVYRYRKASDVYGIPKTTIIELCCRARDESTKSGRKPLVVLNIKGVQS